MTIGFVFWLLMILSLVLGGVRLSRSKDYQGGGVDLLVWVLLALVGWQVFGWPVHE
jgi:hypothetical protein